MSARSYDFSQHDASTLMRWYAVMNSWCIADDFPKGLVEDDFTTRLDYKTRFPKWHVTWMALQGALSEDQKSWGWWREQRLGDFNEWSAWFRSNYKREPTINEQGELT